MRKNGFVYQVLDIPVCCIRREATLYIARSPAAWTVALYTRNLDFCNTKQLRHECGQVIKLF